MPVAAASGARRRARHGCHRRIRLRRSRKDCIDRSLERCHPWGAHPWRVLVAQEQEACTADRPSGVLIRSLESHAVAHAAHRLGRQHPRPGGTAGQRVVHALRSGRQLLGARADRDQLGLDRLGQDLLAIDAAPTRGAALYRDVLHRIRRAERLVEVVDVAHLRRARIGALDPLGVGDGGTQLGPDLRARLEQPDRVTERLGHLRLAVEAHDPARRRQQRLWFWEILRVGRELRIPSARDDARELEMLHLVLADGQ